MTERKGMGRVHDGFYGALFAGDEETGVLFEDALDAIRSADPDGKKAIYITGAMQNPHMEFILVLSLYIHC